MHRLDIGGEEPRTVQQGKLFLFLFVGAVSGILLYIGIQAIREREPLGFLALVGSAVFWWPLFKLGSHHAKKRRPPESPRD
jgi:hypothetical protein